MSWYNNNWKYRKKIIINQQAQSVNNFSFTANIIDGNLSLFTKTDGSDIVFTDINNNVLPFTIAKFKRSLGELSAIIRTDTSNTQNTEIYMYFGNENAIDQSNTDDALSLYSFVSHLSSNPEITPYPIEKSPYNTATTIGTDWDKLQSIKNEYSINGYGMAFKSSEEQGLEVGKLDFTGAQTFAMEAWIWTNNASEDQRIVAQGNGTSVSNQDFNLGIDDKIKIRLRTDLSVASSYLGNTNVPSNQ